MLGSSSSSTVTGNPTNLDAMLSTKVFPCNTCELVFDNSQAQRTHMREPWHVYNIKQRLASLPPISADDYAEKIATSLVSSKQKPSHITAPSIRVRPSSEEVRVKSSSKVEERVSEESQINRCLFCNSNLHSLDANLEHMSSEHGLYIPDIEHLSSLETTVEYLRTVITEYHECLHCGMVKQSTEGIRTHMLDKGHCMINLEREPELLEFWEFSSSEEDNSDDEKAPRPQSQRADATVSRGLEQGEYTLASGKVVGSKGKAREARLSARRIALKATKDETKQMITDDTTNNTDVTSSSNTPESLIRTEGRPQDRTVTKRDAAGLVGVSNQQIRSLVTLQRKMQKQQEIVRASTKWADELGGTHQKHSKQKMNLRDG